MVFSGTHITAGRARAVVTATGVHTEVGSIARMTEGAEEPKTPLELRIAQFGRYLVAAALVLFVVVMVLGLLRGLPFADVVMVAISQMVSMVPEGLPVAMTIALAVGMQRMAGRGAIVRRLSAVETLGSTTVICSDKTGTLTRNEMTVSALWLPGGRHIEVSGAGYAPQGVLTEAGRGGRSRGQRGQRAAEGCRALQRRRTGAAPERDGAVDRARRSDRGCAAGRGGQGRPRRQGAAAVRTAWRRDAVRLGQQDDGHLHDDGAAPACVFIKGAPEAVLRLCAADGPAMQAARDAAERMAGRALRVLAVARVDDDALDAAGGFDAVAGRATLLGLVGQIDPPREEARWPWPSAARPASGRSWSPATTS